MSQGNYDDNDPWNVRNAAGERTLATPLIKSVAFNFSYVDNVIYLTHLSNKITNIIRTFSGAMNA